MKNVQSNSSARPPKSFLGFRHPIPMKRHRMVVRLRALLINDCDQITAACAGVILLTEVRPCQTSSRQQIKQNVRCVSFQQSNFFLRFHLTGTQWPERLRGAVAEVSSR